MPHRPHRSWESMFVRNAALALVYFASARLGLMLALPPEYKATAVWPPSGMALAAMLIGGLRLWPGVFAGAFLTNIWDSFSTADPFAAHFAGSLLIACGSTLQALLGYYAINRWAHGREFPQRASWSLRFIGFAPIICLCSSTLSVLSLCVLGIASWSALPQIWLTWWLGDTAGILTLAPAILAWGQRFNAQVSLRKAAEAVLLAILIALTMTLFSLEDRYFGTSPSSLKYLAVPLVVWAAFGFGLRGATAVVLILAAYSVFITATGNGTFVRQTLNDSLLHLQVFICVLTATGLAVAAVLSERQSAELLLQAVVDETTDAIFVKDIHGRYLMINAAGGQFVGHRPEDLVGKDDYTLFEPESAWRVMERDRRVMAGDGPATEDEVLTAAGTTRTYHSTKAPYRDSRGKVLGLIGVSRDISEHKRAEENLRVSEERLRMAAEATGLVTFDHDIERGAIRWSERFWEMAGLPFSEENNPEHYFTFVHPEDTAMVAAAYMKACDPAGTGIFKCQLRMIRPDGETRRLEAHAQMTFAGENADRKCIRAVGAVLDVTERNLAEQRLILFRELVNRASDVVEVIDPETGRYLDVNDTACRTHGYSRSEYLSLRVADIDPLVAQRP